METVQGLCTVNAHDGLRQLMETMQERCVVHGADEKTHLCRPCLGDFRQRCCVGANINESAPGVVSVQILMNLHPNPPPYLPPPKCSTQSIVPEGPLALTFGAYYAILPTKSNSKRVSHQSDSDRCVTWLVVWVAPRVRFHRHPLIVGLVPSQFLRLLVLSPSARIVALCQTVNR